MKSAGRFEVRYTDGARDDLLRLFELQLGIARTVEDLDRAQAAIDAIREAAERHLANGPLIYRKVGANPFLRELVIPFGASGYVALYEVAADRRVNVLAVRHQREDDYH